MENMNWGIPSKNITIGLWVIDDLEKAKKKK